ncbi:histidine kinase [Leeuwenhoekiella aestuarii]|uniref:Histidine kinase n=1 Tax=Leeuwenhoekiella aestuarii TaxID=2249426 RepID=A0A4Q0NWX0_9FLAO|nr:histidine kinase [Leeuwenhoekiella aestuarii]RXG16053.1 histidine kinase [Leeuwenhoekiella aestuarii]RXG16747.1 histidine kinase [Leeuwenhoekiella aestuarii]
MATLSTKTYQVNTSTQTILIHSGFILIGLSYLFYLLPNWYSNNQFHPWAPAILAGIDVITMYVFFFLIRYFNKSKIFVFSLALLASCIFLYYSAGLNMIRNFPTVLKFSEVSIWFSKSWILATIPRLIIILVASFAYYILLNLKFFIDLINKYFNLEIVINAVLTLGLLFYKTPNYRESDFMETMMIKLLLITLFYAHAFLISPLLLITKKYKRFTIWLVVSYILCISVFLIPIYYKGVINSFDDFLRFLTNLTIVLTICTALGLLYGFIRFLIIKRFKKTQKALGNTTSELLLLKSQVNPHFLFNTLNTLYATALEEKATVTASATAKLANLVRYMQQDMQQEFIPLEREAGYVSDYINIQKLRIASPLEVNTVFEDLNDTQISPGLLIPFVENAFKYGIDPDRNSRIDSILRVQENTIYFRCENEYNINHTTYYREKGFGIGIKNTRERLDLIYPKKYQLDVEKTENLFTVTLKINTL